MTHRDQKTARQPDPTPTHGFAISAVAGLLLVGLGLTLVGCAPAPKPKNRELEPAEVAEMRYQMADRLVADGDYDRALPYIRSLVARRPDDLRLRLLLGIVLREKEMHRVAARELSAVVKKAPNSAPARAAYAVLLDKMGKHKQAEQNHRLAVKLAPRDARYHNDLGFCLFLQRRFDEAQEKIEEAISIDPGMRRAYNNLGYVHGLQGDEAAAMRAFRQAGSKAMALTNMGLVAEMRGQPQHARRYYERALRARPNYPPALRNLRALQPQVRSTDAAGRAAGRHDHGPEAEDDRESDAVRLKKLSDDQAIEQPKAQGQSKDSARKGP